MVGWDLDSNVGRRYMHGEYPEQSARGRQR